MKNSNSRGGTDPANTSSRSRTDAKRSVKEPKVDPKAPVRTKTRALHKTPRRM